MSQFKRKATGDSGATTNTTTAASKRKLDTISSTQHHQYVEKLDVFRKPHFDESIVKEDFYTYLPFTLNSDYSDTIRIEIQSSDTIIGLYDSYIQIKGTYTPKTAGNTNFQITNNFPYYLFDEMQLIVGNNHIVDVCKLPGITSTIKGLASYTKEDRGLGCTGWKIEVGNEEENVNGNGRFTCCIPLNKIFGFVDDYRKALVNMRCELVMIRAKNDFNCYKSPAGDAGTDVEFKINRISWEVPHIRLADEAKLNLLNNLRTNPSIVCGFRQWDLHLLPAIGLAKTQVWRIKNSNELEKPRWMIIMLQNERERGVRAGDASKFTHSNLTDIKVHLNSQVFPYQRMNLDFANNDYMVAYLNYKRFREGYYADKDYEKCLITYSGFKEKPVFVIDCTRQEESTKDSTVDIRLELESSENFDNTTKVYCLILHDSLMEYNPITETVLRYVHV